MPAGITYEGVVPQDGVGGTLFKGLKFWISLHVPMRTTCIQNIKSNGGVVVNLEKNADYLLVDHARPNSLPGAYSWKLIADSLEAGALKRIEDYLCTDPTRTARPVGSSLPQKGTRTPFTSQDDQILSKWVAKNEKLGMGIYGNVIYKDLEEKYPHHTWQSWKNRYKEKVSYLPKPPVSDGESSAPPEPEPSRGTAASITPSRSRTRHPATSTRTPFTHEHDMILLEYIRQCQSEAKHTSGNAIYEALALDFPQHTMHSWRDRWLRYWKPRSEGGASDNASIKSPSRVRKAGNSSRTSKRSDRQELSREEEEEAPATEEPKDQNASRVANEEEDEDDNELQERSPPKPTRARTEVPSVRSQEPQEEIEVDSQPPSPKLPPNGNSIKSRHETPLFAEEPDLKTQFNADYQEYINNLESQAQAQWWPTIRGKTLELWQLWQAVQSQKVEPEERDWQQISETLGFNWVEDDSVPDEVRHCYETHLAEFEVFLVQFDGQSDDEDETQANPILEPLMPSSPTSLPPPKRSHATALGPDSPYLGSSPKRLRHSRDDEVPSTPDEKNGTSHLRRRAMSPKTGSPSLGGRENVLHQTPSRRSAAKAEDPQSFDEQVESQVNITPSQQLRLEFEEAVTPTPLNPFIEQDPDEPDDRTPRASSTAAPTTSSKLKRRSLPRSFNQFQSPRANGSPVSRSRQQRDPSPATADQSPAARPQLETRAPVKESPEDIIDFYMSLGYSQNVVVRSLNATTWVPGLASQLMEMLKRGESLPTNWRGVWTQKDDEALKAIVAAADDQPPKDAKEKRKKDKQMEKLEKKHTREGMDMRIKFFEESNGVVLGGRRVRFAEGGSEVSR